MGVTIHYKGALQSMEDVAVLTDHVEADAGRLGWHVQRFDPLGLAVLPSEKCDPIELRPDNDLVIDSFVKTQFAGPETHIDVIGFLRRLAPYLSGFEVDDEGDYFATEDEALLRQHMKRFEEALAVHLIEHPRAQGPVRLPNGRWVDVLE